MNNYWSVWIKKQDGNNVRWISFVLFVISFGDSSFVPIPAQAILIILIVANPACTIRYLTASLTGSLIGSLVGYSAGYIAAEAAHTTQFLSFLYDRIPGFSEQAYLKACKMFIQNDFWFLFIASLTPVPYGLFTVVSGLLRLNPAGFIFITLFAISFKYYVITYVVARFGNTLLKNIKVYLRNYITFGLITIILILFNL